MPRSLAGIFSRRFTVVAGTIFTVAVIAWLIAYETVTRNLVASDAVCTYCHMEREYVADARLSFSIAHPVEPKEGESTALCVDCHLPEGFWAATFTYTHYISATDLFGHFRDRAPERAGEWIPAAAARAYRVRDRLFDEDSVTCRSCHIEAQIKPKRKRGQKAHKNAMENEETCIECHDNLVHRQIDLRPEAFQKPDGVSAAGPLSSPDEKLTSNLPEVFTLELRQ